MSCRSPARAGEGKPYRLADLMHIFDYADEDCFRAWRKRVNFPAPIEGCTRPLKWDREIVDAWRRGARANIPANDAAPAIVAPVDEVAAARERLRLKAARR